MALGLGACADERRPPPPAPHVDLTQPVALIPADVDLVLRVDVRRFCGSTGSECAQTLANVWRGFLLDPGAGTPNLDWISQFAKETDTLWLGCRLGPHGCRDYVAVLRGHFVGGHQVHGLGPDKYRRDLGGGWASYDFGAGAEQRSQIARAYFRPPELVVLVSPVELDSAERSVEKSEGVTDLVAREAGLVSVLVRSHALASVVRDRSRKAADWLDASSRVEIGVESQPEHTLVTFAVTFSDANEAERAAQAIKMLTDSLAQFDRRIAPSDLDVQQLDADVVLRVRLRREVPSR